MSKAITEKQDEHLTGHPQPSGPVNVRETAPSVVREDEPNFPRAVGMIGGALVIFGGMALGFNLIGRSVRVGSSWAILCLATGLCGLLFHAAFDRDTQFRRLYMAFGFALLVVGAVLSLVPYPRAIGDQLRWGAPCLFLALLFLLAFLRNEDDLFFRDTSQKLLAGAGALLAVVGLFGGLIKGEFFLPIGLVYSLIGLLYLAGFIGSRGISDDLAYYAALGLSVVGAAFIVLTLGRSIFTATGSSYFVSFGLVILIVGTLYVVTGLGMSLDWPVCVLTRRELGSFFYSPIAYLTFFGFAICSFPGYLSFIALLSMPQEFGTVTEPIIHRYFIAIFPVIALIVVVPVLTMRLLSEEQRTGTMEVLLTAPVDETVVVLSKFLVAIVTYLCVWLPFGLYLLAIPLAGGNPFDYRPLLSFLIALVVTGAGFISMGLFFSSLTKNQIASGVLTAAGMMALTYTYMAAENAKESHWRTILTHMSYIHVWSSTLHGKIVPQFLLFYLSLTILNLFLTVKVLESRKWR